MKLTYLKFLKYGIDLAPLGLERSTGDETYFAPPRGPKSLAGLEWTGFTFALSAGLAKWCFPSVP